MSLWHRSLQLSPHPADRAVEGPGVAMADARGLGGLRSPPAHAVQRLRRQQEDARHRLTRLWHILDVVRAGGDGRGQGTVPPKHHAHVPVLTVAFLPQAVATRRGSAERCHQGQEQRWGQRSPEQENPSPNPACSRAGGVLGTPPVPAGCGRCQELGEGRALALRLRDEFGRLLAQARRLPAPLRDRAQQAQDNMGELHRAFVLAGSLRELEEALSTQGHRWVAQAWEALEALVGFLLRHPQEPWQGEVVPAAPARE